MKKTFVYPAIFIKDKQKDEQHCTVLFPDLDITTDGNFMEEAYLYAKECLKAYFVCAEKYDFEYNLPSEFETKQKTTKSDECVMLIDTTITDKDLK